MTCFRMLPFTLRQLSVKHLQALFPFTAFTICIIHGISGFVKGFPEFICQRAA